MREFETSIWQSFGHWQFSGSPTSHNGMVRPCVPPRQQSRLARGANDKEHAMSQNLK